MDSNRLGRPELPADQRRENRKSVYLDEQENRDFLALYLASNAPSQSAFLAELMRYGLEIKRQQLAATRGILGHAA